jgi:hypothetical protein
MISGLTNATPYTFRVFATNATGSSSASPASAPVTPAASRVGGGSYFGSMPAAPLVSNVDVKPGSGSVTVTVKYSGDRSAEPTGYVVKTMPGGNSCIINGASSSCEIIGLQSGVSYTISMEAQNSWGTSAALSIASIRTLSAAESSSVLGTKSVWGFAGDSAKLTDSHKKVIKKYLAANTKISDITCTGYTAGKRVLKSDKTLAHARAVAVCSFIQKMRPSISTTIVGKTPGLPWGAKNRRVDIKAFSWVQIIDGSCLYLNHAQSCPDQEWLWTKDLPKVRVAFWVAQKMAAWLGFDKVLLAEVQGLEIEFHPTSANSLFALWSPEPKCGGAKKRQPRDW